MRLWHQVLIPFLPGRQLLGLHRECCALRGLSWGRRHRTVQYVFKYDLGRLFAYHKLVMEEMDKRGYRVGKKWLAASYRGKRCPPLENAAPFVFNEDGTVYPEHDRAYLEECLANLRRKGVVIEPGIF